MHIYKDKVMDNALGTIQTFSPESGFKIPTLLEIIFKQSCALYFPFYWENVFVCVPN